MRAPPANRVGEVEDEPAGARHAKVEDDPDTDVDLMKISFSRRHDYEDIDIETGGSGSDEMEGTAFVSRHTANTDGQVPAVKRSGMTLEPGPKTLL